MKNQKKVYPVVQTVGFCIIIPMVFLAGPAVGFLFGSWLDRVFGWEPWGKTILSLFGFAASVRQVYDLIKRVIKNSE